MKPRYASALAILITIALTNCATTPPAKNTDMLDLKITNGRVLDGTGAPWYRADVGLRGDTIVAIGDLHDVAAKSTIDAQDRMVSPGFIDLLGQSQSTMFEDPQLEAKVRQGVTTEVTGEGHSPGPVSGPPTEKRPWSTLGEYLDLIDRKGVAVNFAFLVGASNARELVIGDVNRQPTAAELHQMEGIIDQAMREGAIGLSTSLIYVPAMYSTTEEIIALARVAAKYQGMYFTHMRDEGDRIDMGLDEAFRIGREAKIPVNIWHLKVGGRANWGRMPHVVARIEEAKASGLDVAANVYPYIASGTGLSTLAPDWALEGGYDDFRKRLADPTDRARIAETLRAQVAKRHPHGIFVSYIFNRALAQYEKKFIEDIATEMSLPEDEALIRLFAESENSPRVIFFSMNEDDVQHALRQPWVSAGADSGAPPPSARETNAASHPRGYGTFPRIVGHYVRDVKLFTLEEAVRKLTSQAALRVGFHDRGILREGMKADLIVFDPATIADRSTFEDPHHFSEGVSDVIVNGVPVLRGGTMTGALPGKSIRGKGYVKP
jgi:dihydroorotase/N-acyl-D-amino-acid deacylase